MTLIEVMTALAILGVLLVTVLAARARYIHQYSTASMKSTATAGANELLKAWWQSSQGIPVPASGALPENPELIWTTKVTKDHVDGLDDLKVVALSVEPLANPALDPPLVSIELLQPNPPLTKEQP